MEPLENQRCEPCHGGIPPLSRAEAVTLADALDPAWRIDDSAGLDETSSMGVALTRDYTLGNFKQAMAFANRVADIAEEQGHHPDILIHGWKYVTLRIATHATGGLSKNDFILAARIDAS